MLWVKNQLLWVIDYVSLALILTFIQFNGLRGLQILVLDANLIQTIDGHVFTNLKKLEYLYMRENRLVKYEFYMEIYGA